jgi:hypothetical protein
MKTKAEKQPQPKTDRAAANRNGLRRPVLSIGRPGDAFERAADHAAQTVVHQSRPSGKPLASVPTINGNSAAESHATPAPPAVNEVLESPGQRLDDGTRSFMEPRFAFDFSKVRVHTDGRAADSARTVGAVAYTIGRDMVFGAGQYAPQTGRGQRLIAHELAHVVQQGGSASLLQCKVDLDDFDVDKFSIPDLQAYLAKIQAANDIENDLDSDNKARTIVKEWRKGTDDFFLEPASKVLLIKEMQKGFTGNDDERAILTLLVNSTHADIEAIFAPGEIDPEDLDGDFHGDEEDELRAFYDREFQGGRAAALKGSRGLQPEKLLKLKSPYSRADLRSVIDQRLERIDRTVRDRDPLNREWMSQEMARVDAAEIYAELQNLKPEERDHAASDMAQDRVKRASQTVVIDDEIANAKDKATKEKLKRKQIVMQAEVMILDLAMEPVFKDIALASPTKKADFLKQTTKLSEEQKKAAREAITTVTKAEAIAEAKGEEAPVVLPKFVEKLPGEKESYGDKIDARIPKLIKAYHDTYGKGRDAARHGNKKLTHDLTELQIIANQSKDEVDKVFGSFYAAKDFNAFQADVRSPTGKMIKRGSIHDAWQDEEDNRKNDKTYEQRSAKFWLYYLIQNDNDAKEADSVSKINYAHNASPEFGKESVGVNDEAKIIRKVGDPYLKSHTTELFEIGRGWDAYNQTREVSIQLFKDPDSLKDRRFLWDMFFTLIHEYLHSLSAREYSTYADNLGGEHSTEGNTLIEGVDSLLTEIAWTSAVLHAPSAGVRSKVEPDAVLAGEPFDPSLLPTMPHRRYDTYTQAVKLLNVVGIRNLYAAYFQGKIKLIGAK